jgi:RNA polymerase sigma factor (TIGR02999 family)
MSEVTGLLEAAERGEPQAAEELLPLVYEELRRLAAVRMANEKPGQTLQPTALVHEAWLRLASEDHDWRNRKHFFSAAAEAMRRILVERARRKQRRRHGGQMVRVNLEDIDLAAESESETVLFVDEALERLAAEDPTVAELIRLRFFVGMPNQEAAALLGLSERTARRDWAYARAWLARELAGPSGRS